MTAVETLWYAPSCPWIHTSKRTIMWSVLRWILFEFCNVVIPPMCLFIHARMQSLPTNHLLSKSDSHSLLPSQYHLDLPMRYWLKKSVINWISLLPQSPWGTVHIWTFPLELVYCVSGGVSIQSFCLIQFDLWGNRKKRNQCQHRNGKCVELCQWQAHNVVVWHQRGK